MLKLYAYIYTAIGTEMLLNILNVHIIFLFHMEYAYITTHYSCIFSVHLMYHTFYSSIGTSVINNYAEILMNIHIFFFSALSKNLLASKSINKQPFIVLRNLNIFLNVR